MASQADERLYDRYLDACLDGHVRNPDSFFREHPEADSQVRARIEALFRMLREDERAPREAAEGLPFERLGEFRLLQPLDAGGMGAVYLAEQESLGRVVALKIIRPELQASEEAGRRFEREAQAVARLRHPNIVTIHEAGIDRGVRYLAMELVQGRRLDDILALGEPLSVGRVLRWIAKLARALDCAHKHGIVHRDVKPSNIRITPEDEPLLLDFGVARDIGADLTLTAAFTGSPPYAAPEQIQPGRTVDPRTDVYALGATLYQCLTGRVPFQGETVAEIFHGILTAEPLSPRHLNASVGRELETVTRKAMEKKPDARYATAGEFADDLEALLEFRPIRARPPGAPARLYKWARRRPGAAVAVGAALLFAALLAAQGWTRARERVREARRLVARARDAIGSFREERDRTFALERDFAQLDRAVHLSYFTPAQDRRFAAEEAEVKRRRRRREELFYEVLDLLRRAEQLDADVPGADAVRLELYIERWQQALLAGDAEASAFYQGVVESRDPSGDVVRRLYGIGRLAWTCDTAGAEAHLFRYRLESEIQPQGEHRMVPVPWRGDSAVRPGTFALRVVRGAGDLEPGDLILEVAGHGIRDTVFVDGARAEFRSVIEAEEQGVVQARSPADLAEAGGVEALVFRDRETRTVTLPPGLAVRTTAAPFLVGASSRLDAPEVDLDPGDYLLLVRRRGCEEARYGFTVERNATATLHVRLRPAGTTPAGFVHVPAYGADAGFWIMEREVSVLEYFEFLNAPETLREIAEARSPIRVPRFVEAPDGVVAPGPDGRYDPRDLVLAFGTPVAEANPDPSRWPILCVSWEDAVAYAEWKGRRDGREYALPTEQQWNRAARGGTSRRFVFGDAFRPKWACSCFSRPIANVQPFLRYPVDESPLGVFDMAGSASEWLADPHLKKPNMIQHAGGAWAFAQPHIFQAPGGNISGGKPDWTKGFRLVLAEAR